MASNNGGKDVMETGTSDVNSSTATVEIKIKTLDSQTYTLRVDKCVPVPALKEQIALVTGVLSEQQRLICRGKVLKDDQLLSAYHVEDGHTLHLVVRQPIDPTQGNVPDHTANGSASSTRPSIGSQRGPSIVVETFNISNQGDGNNPDFSSRIVSAVLDSLASGGEAVDLQRNISERLSQIPGVNEIRNSTGQQHEDASANNVFMEQLPVIPDSLSTLSQYLRRLRQEFNDNVVVQGNSSQSHGGGNAGVESHAAAAPHSAAVQGGLPTPAALGDVIQSTRQLLIEQVGDCLMQLTTQLGNQTNVTDQMARSRMQSNAMRSGSLLQNLGAFLLELGRTTMTLRLGRTPTDAVVNAGPAVFISPSGPNPIMVQPLPFQPGTRFGTAPTGAGTNFSVGSGSRSGIIDISIRTGSVLSSASNQRETSGGQQPAAESATSDNGIPNQQATAGNIPQTRGGPGVRVVPILVSTAPPGVAPSESIPMPPGLDQILGNLFRGEPNHGGSHFVVQGPLGSGSVEPVRTNVNAEETSVVSDEGRFLSNLLNQIMPVVSQHINGGPNGSSVQRADVENRAAQPSSRVSYAIM
ncbi:ubiquitin-like domain-containing protein CIP73 [Rutidosis leptorrhynchoides]|uniref:ubiquitin-like domain-containing protein CIP73 n=1 Tax=Rutidosis leptorrhynchoides TaxID=125765 RepID=UPI003A99E2A3